MLMFPKRLTDMVCEAQEPEAIAEFLARFYRLASDCIVGLSGTVDKVLGDGIMAYFGAPAGLADKEGMAVSTALAAIERFSSLSRELAGRGYPDLQLRCAVTTGYVTLGTFGDQRHATFTVIGRTVNLASRLQALAAPGNIVVDRPTAMRVEGEFVLARLDMNDIKGIERQVEVWKVIGRRAGSLKGEDGPGGPAPTHTDGEARASS